MKTFGKAITVVCFGMDKCLRFLGVNNEISNGSFVDPESQFPVARSFTSCEWHGTNHLDLRRKRIRKTGEVWKFSLKKRAQLLRNKVLWMMVNYLHTCEWVGHLDCWLPHGLLTEEPVSSLVKPMTSCTRKWYQEDDFNCLLSLLIITQ